MIVGGDRKRVGIAVAADGAVPQHQSSNFHRNQQSKTNIDRNNNNNNNNNNQSYNRMLDRSMELWYGTNRTNDKKQCEQQQKQWQHKQQQQQQQQQQQ